MKYPDWVLRIRKNKEIVLRRKFWNDLLPNTRLVYVEKSNGLINLNTEHFQLTNGATFEEIRQQLDKVQIKLGTQMVAICPVGLVLDVGDEDLGTIGLEGFRIIWTADTSLPKLFDTRLSQNERDFIARIQLMPIFNSIDVIGYCPLLHCRLISTKRSAHDVIALSFVSRSGAKIEDFLALEKEIKTNNDAELVEFSHDGDFDSSMIVSVIIMNTNEDTVSTETAFVETGTIPLSKGIRTAQVLLTKEI